MKPYTGRKLVYCRQVPYVFHDGARFSRSQWKDALEKWGWVQPGDRVYNSFSDSMDTVERVEVVREPFYRAKGSFVIEFWVRTTSGAILSHAHKSREDWMSWWGVTEADIEYVKAWNRGEAP